MVWGGCKLVVMVWERGGWRGVSGDGRGGGGRKGWETNFGGNVLEIGLAWDKV